MLLFVESQAIYIGQDGIDTTKVALQVSQCREIKCVEYSQNVLERESYSTTNKGRLHTTYIVNIEDENEVKSLILKT